jgi:hypothetical protein
MVTDFNTSVGEFSPERDSAFERHLRRLKMKVDGLIAHEPMWYTIKPSWLERNVSIKPGETIRVEAI